MITRLGVENRNSNSNKLTTSKQNKLDKNPNFKAGSPWGALLWGIQQCEANPMVNVAVVDMFSAILPRTFVESLTNWFAGFEAFRRESSGLIVNCIIPGAVAWLGANCFNNLVMPKNTNMTKCWGDSALINRATELYTKSKSDDKVRDALKEILANIEGWHGKEKILFNDVLKNDIDLYADKLKALSVSKDKKLDLAKEVDKIAKEIAEKTHIYEKVKVKGEKPVNAKTVASLLEDSVRYFKEYQKVEKSIPIEEFAQKAKKLIKSKSIFGLAIILPLAASMQSINRWITKKVSGVEGAPIYDDFGKEQNEAVRKKSQEGLLKQKLISIGSMIGVSLLSIMKKPTFSMLEFKGWFPTMDQARVISTTTFASRMAVADDKNELAEATIRDIATFSGLYFLGDYAGKATATAIENKTGIKLLNDTKPLKGDENILKRFWHWVKDVNIKSSEEVVSNLAEQLKLQKKAPNATESTQIKKELNKAINMRRACQAANLGVSLLLLGLIVPIWTRCNTKKKHAEALKLAQEQANKNIKAEEPSKV